MTVKICLFIDDPPRETSQLDVPGRQSDQAKITGARNGVVSGRHVELPEDALGMGFDCIEGKVKVLGDLPLGQIGTKQPEHSELSIAQLIRVRPR